MARPKKLTDEQLLDAAGAVISRKGPRFSLADVASEAGVSVGTIAGRFGSRLELLRALSNANVVAVRTLIRTNANSAASPVDGIRDALVNWFAVLDDASTAANHLAALGEDLLEPQLRESLAELFAVVQAELRKLLRAAEPQLPFAPPAAHAAKLLVSLVHGSTLDWALRPNGRLRTRLIRDIDAVLAGWRSR